jgi:hypothetical protein
MGTITKLISKLGFACVLVATCGTQCCPCPGGGIPSIPPTLTTVLVS